MKSQLLTSTKNEKVKEAIALRDRRQRDQSGLMLIEGIKEVALAVGHGIVISRLYCCEELFGGEEPIVVRSAAARGAEIVSVNHHVFEKMVYREGSAGLLAIAVQPKKSLEDLRPRKVQFIVVIEGVEKPGNLGAVLRTADAAGVDGIIVCGKSTDIYNPNVIRASIGTIFTVPVVQVPTEDAIRWLRKKGIRTVASTPTADVEYFDADLRGPSAIIMGSEHAGLSDTWLREADIKVRIPMSGEADSLNLAASTALLLYETVRQRRGE